MNNLDSLDIIILMLMFFFLTSVLSEYRLGIYILGGILAFLYIYPYIRQLLIGGLHV